MYHRIKYPVILVLSYLVSKSSVKIFNPNSFEFPYYETGDWFGQREVVLDSGKRGLIRWRPDLGSTGQIILPYGWCRRWRLREVLKFLKVGVLLPFTSFILFHLSSISEIIGEKVDRWVFDVYIQFNLFKWLKLQFSHVLMFMSSISLWIKRVEVFDTSSRKRKTKEKEG